MADTQSPQEGTSLAPSDVRALLAEISRISNDYDLRERIKEYDNALADSFIWRDCMEEADRLTTAARRPDECTCDQMRAEGYREVCPYCIATKDWSRAPTPVEIAAREPEAMADQSTEARLREAIARIVDPEAFRTLREIVAERGLDASKPPPGVVLLDPIDGPRKAMQPRCDEALAKAAAILALSLPVQDTSDELTRLRAEVEARDEIVEAARDLVMKPGGLVNRGVGVGLVVVEKADKSDPHYRLCTAFERFDARTTLNGEQANGG